MKKSITLLTTTRYDLHCQHCLREDGASQEDVDIPLTLLENALRAGRKLGFVHVALTGGEPGLHPRFAGLVALVNSLGFTWSIVSNGWLPERYGASLRQCGETCTFTGVSLDGLAVEHDRVRGRGSFERALQAIEFFKGLGAPVTISFTLNPLNYAQLPDILELALSLEVKRITVVGVIPTAANRALLISPEQKQAAHAFLCEARETFPIPLTTTTSLYTVADPEKFYSLLDYPDPTLNAYGQYLFCCDTIGRGAPLGDLRVDSFGDLYLRQLETGARLKEIRREMIEKGQVFEGFDSCHFCNTILQPSGINT